MSIKTFEGAAGQEGAQRTSTLVHPHELLSIKKIEEGAFGVVERCLYKTEGRTVAVKKLNPMTAEKKKDRIESLKTEIAVLKRLHHKNIIQYIGHGNVDTNTPETADKTQFLVLELLQGGSLKKLVGRQMAAPRGTQLYSDKQAVQLLLGVAKGLQYLHSRRPMVIHRDLKLENVMLDGSSPEDFCPKIVDFGCAALVGKPTKSRFAQDVAAGLQSNRILPVSRSGSDSSPHPDGIATPRQSREYTPVESWNDNYVEGFYCPPGPSSPLAHFQSRNWENAEDVIIMAGSLKALQDIFFKKDVGPTIQHFVQGGGLQLHARSDSPTQGTFMKPVPNPKLIKNDAGAPNLSENSVACLEQAWTEHARTRRVPIMATSKTKAVGLLHIPSDSSIPVEVEMDLSNLRISKPEDHLSGRTGTLLYMAPDVYFKRPYDDKADVFSFGAIAYELLHRYDMVSAIGRTLQECEAYARRVATGRFRPPIDDTMAPPLADFIRSCWEGDPKRRPSMDQIVNKLEDFLVTMDDWQHPLGNRSSSEEPEDRQQDPLSRATAICGCCIS
ncbi:hypothetical protein CEUSTIGMA_g9272.t1 [Chlamydomonas eustigma]|uniref:Protein kinase domain-containing protein n=1 Tax=Chlamydomonas eustigma TaxID=1157962 RepID=A0A250XFI8_9CHLO|nr:hypothetical protein CEUSTIGMA_g9272.t1 [Chlamydomonas eustigma]|eukprot:GAX81844.1 hypothetical protein CEUSTIGMA_g9272.t1 [Chlamydomonas eustigma]